NAPASGGSTVTLAKRAPGGLHIAGPSRNVYVLENDISGGLRNGITLGDFIFVDPNGGDPGGPTGVTVYPDPECCNGGSIEVPGPPPPGTKPGTVAAGGLIINLHIHRNRIHDVGLCGIGPVGYFDLTLMQEIISLVNVSICENIISRTMLRRGIGYRSPIS